MSDRAAATLLPARSSERLRAELETNHAVALRQFLPRERALLIADELERATFRFHTIEATGKRELVMEPNAASALLLMALNDPAVFDLVEAVTGCEPIGSFRSRTYRMLPTPDFVSNWHNDALPMRLAALSINLSPEPYEGAALQVRDAVTRDIVCEIDDLAFGDAVLIEISRAYEHRNSPLLGSSPKTSYAGFFYAGEPSPLARR